MASLPGCWDVVEQATPAGIKPLPNSGGGAHLCTSVQRVSVSIETRESCPFQDFDYCTEFLYGGQIQTGDNFQRFQSSPENEGILLANLGGRGS